MKRVRYIDHPIDTVDSQIIAALNENGRLTMTDLASQVGLTAPSVTERVRRLEESGVIAGYTARINPHALGATLAVYIRIRPLAGELSRVSRLIREIDQIVECHRITGEDCFIARAYVVSVQELEAVIDRLHPYASTNTSLIQSTIVELRMPAIPK